MLYSACIEMLFVDGSSRFEDRIARAAAAGFAAVEFWSWRDKDLRALRRALRENEVEVASFCVEPRVPIVDPGTHGVFVEGVRESIEVARELGAPNLIVLTGDERPGVPRVVQRRAVVEALRRAAPFAAEGGVRLVLEPLNTLVDHPGYFLHDTREAVGIVREVGSDGVGLLYDLYHSVVMGEEPQGVLADAVPLVGHVHLADAPGRHEPGSGGMPWREHLAWLRERGYGGFVGLEYEPSRATLESLRVLERDGTGGTLGLR